MKIIFYWLAVILPLAWGVTKSVKKALPLFQDGEAPATRVSLIFDSQRTGEFIQTGTPVPLLTLKTNLPPVPL